MYALITLPEPTSILSNSAPWFNAWFAEYLPYLYIGVGIIGAFVMIRFLTNLFINRSIMMMDADDNRYNWVNSGDAYKRYKKQRLVNFWRTNVDTSGAKDLWKL